MAGYKTESKNRLTTILDVDEDVFESFVYNNCGAHLHHKCSQTELHSNAHGRCKSDGVPLARIFSVELLISAYRDLSDVALIC
jgi:hypothetical protein